MRFCRGQRFSFEDTSRKRAAVLVRQRKDRERLPLFAPLIAETQPGVDQVMIEREANWRRAVQRTRDERAAKWRQARSALSAFPEPERRALLAYWNGHRWLPGDPTYLAGELHSFRTGRLVLAEGRIQSAHEIVWREERDAKIRAMTDAELDHMIQTHISMQFVELGRDEKRRRRAA